MNYYITMTTKCNMHCSYCYGKSCEDFGNNLELNIDYSLPQKINYEIKYLIDFLKQDPEPTLIFYGGEPILELENMKKIMENITPDRCILQTNGMLLDKLDREIINHFNTILVSIDGDEETTDNNRGKDSYKVVINHLKALKKWNFEGELIARMTVPVNTQIDKQVNWLLSNQDFPFTSIHWQLDALFWQNDFNFLEFSNWSHNIYDYGVRNLVKMWIKKIDESGEILKIYPFIGIMRSLLRDEKSKLRCGAGWNTFNIQTDGKISACPVMAGMKDFYLGDIWTSNPQNLKDSCNIGKPCIDCEISDLCGGRCLYANVTKFWGENGFKLVCKTVANLIDSLIEFEPTIRKLIDDGKMKIEDFNYDMYNSCEIIP
ncbi:TIGR04084 family radical SAM/SPASM domain-containing protein [[Eubacterium] cellulosolvens]